MPPALAILKVLGEGAMLLLAFTGAGLYFRGFWIYFRAVAWIHKAEQADLRRRYRSSALAALLREPSLAAIGRQFKVSLLGLPIFALGGALFNALQNTH